MGREKKTFWLPVARLAAFFAAVVMAGNAFFHSFRSATASIPQDPEENVDQFTRRKNRLARKFYRLLGSFTEAPASAATAVPIRMGDSVPRPILSTLAPLGPGRIAVAEPSPERLGFLEPVPELFVWPAPLIRFSAPESILPKSLGFAEWPDFRAELVTNLYRRCGRDPLADVVDALLIWPEMVIDEVSLCISGPAGHVSVRTWEDEENRSVTSRLMDVQFARRDQRIFAVFLQQWTEREQKYLGAFEDSRANTNGFQNRTEGADLRELGLDQRKVLLDALRRTYLARYKMQSEEHIPEEAWACDRWSGLDFMVLPPLIGGLLYYRGLNKKISMGDTALRISFEPISELVHRKHDRSVAAALEWTIKGFPVGVIVSAGFHDRQYGMDFIGIGTSIGAARSAVELQYEDGGR